MTEAQAIELISEQMNSAWPAASTSTAFPSGVPVVYENEALPTDSEPTFALCSFVPSVAQTITMGAPGSRRVERRGYVMVKIWAPADAGAAFALSLADAARVVFENKDLFLASPTYEPVTILAGATQKIGVDGRWFMLAVSFPYRFYATS